MNEKNEPKYKRLNSKCLCLYLNDVSPFDRIKMNSAQIEVKRKYSFGAHRSAASLCDEKSHALQISSMKSSNMQHIHTTKSYICMSQSTESMRRDGKRYLERLRTAPHNTLQASGKL